MTPDLRPLEEQCIVLTGATSGIGLTTARMAADRGARAIVLVARSQEALSTLADEINSHPGPTRAVAVAGDVADMETHQRAARAAIENFGRIDTWINDAAISIYGRLTDVADEDNRRLFETNFWGVVYGSQTAAEYLSKDGGALINMGSVASERSIPVQGMYAASKHAVKGFTDALRIELEADEKPISVSLIKPASINTPFTLYAKNYMEDEPSLPPPVYDPSLVAETILYAAENPVRDMFVGGAAKLFTMGETYAPRITDKVMENLTIKQMHSGRPKRHTDALYTPSNNLQQRGEYDGMVRKFSCYTEAVTHPVMSVAALVGLGALAAAGGLAMMNRR